ncbi:MAG: chromosome partitioning protein ParB, partial [Rubrivivax sp.]|nr:chromosome partitioning protein ParB [Rubrivivax sp.]
QVMTAHEVAARKLSVREAERLVARASAPEAAATRGKPPKPRDIVRLEQRLADLLTAAVEIRIKRRTRRGEQGELAIAFGSLDELNGLLDKLGVTES